MTALCPNHPTPHQADAGQICTACLGKTRRQLLDLPILYRLLEMFLPPGNNGGTGKTSNGKNAPLPVNIQVLSLRQQGGILGTLRDWEIDWRETRGDKPAPFRGDTLTTIQTVVRWLDGHLPWAAVHHPAIHEFTGEIRRLWTEALHAGQLVNRPITAREPCIQCGAPLERHYRATGLDDHWHCANRDCATVYDDIRYGLAIRAAADQALATTDEVAARYGLKPTRIRQWAARGKIHSWGVDQLTGQLLYDPFEVGLVWLRHTDGRNGAEQAASG